MASLGKLTADLALNIAQFVAPLNKAEAELVQFHKNVEKGFNSMVAGVTGAVAGMAAGVLSIAGATAALRSSMEWSAEVKNLADTTGEAVGAMDQLALTAKLGDVEASKLGASMAKLSKNMVEATNPTKAMSETFAALGVQVTNADGSMRKSTDVFMEAGKAIASIEDPTLATAAAMAVFGKGGEQLIPMFKDADESARQAAEAIAAFGPATDTSVKAAKDLGDTFVLMRTGVDRLVAPIVTALSPAFAQILEAFKALQSEGGGLMAFLGTALVAVIKVAATAVVVLVTAVRNVLTVFKGLAEGIGAILSGDFGALKGIAAETFKDLEGSAVSGAAAVTALWTPITETGTAAAKAAVDTDKLKGSLNGTTEASKKAQEEIDKLRAKFANMLAADTGGLAPQTTALLDDLRKAQVPIDKYLALSELILASDSKVAQAQKDRAAYTAELNEATGGLSKSTMEHVEWLGKQYDATYKTTEGYKAYLAAVERLIAKDPLIIAQQKEKNDLAEQEAALLRELNELKYKEQAATDAAILAEYAVNKQMQDNLDVMGLTGVERDRAINQQQAAAAVAKVQGEFGKSVIQGYYDERDALIVATHARQQYIDVMNKAIDIGAELFSAMADGMKGISDWAKRAGEDLKRYLLNVLYGATVKPFIIQVVAGAAGGAAGNAGAAASAAGSGLQGSTLLNAGVTAAGWLGGAEAAGTFGQFAALGMADAATALGIAATEGAATIGGLAAVAGSLAAFIPVIGAVAAIGYLAYTLLSQPAGGPKAGGFGQTGSANAVRYFTPSDQDAVAMQVAGSVQTAYENAVTAFGGQLESAGFALGFDTDPQGTAQNRVSGGAFVGGRQVFGVTNLEAGRDDETLQATMGLVAKRALLAALQASDLPEAITAILNTVSAAAATEDAITGVLALAGAFKTLQDVIEDTADPLTAAQEAMAGAARTSLQVWQAQRTAVHELADAAEPTVEGMNALSQATAGLYASTVQLLAGILQLEDALHAMFQSTRESIETSLLSPEQVYDRYSQQNDALMAQLEAATDPADIDRISQQLNANLGKMWDLFMAAPGFDAMTPEQRDAAQAQFLQDLTDVEATATDRLGLVADTVQQQAQTDRDYMSATLADILTAITTAGGDFSAGAAAISTAANRGIDVRVSVADDRAIAEVSAGP